VAKSTALKYKAFESSTYVGQPNKSNHRLTYIHLVKKAVFAPSVH